MKVLLHCRDCLAEDGLDTFEFRAVTVNDELFFMSTCSKGHENVTILQQPKHEILFELGMNALADGYPREAVTSFASSLESFYKLCINQVPLHKESSSQSIEEGWKHLANYSERQLGAIIMLWIVHLDSPPRLLNDKMRRLRNNVVHKGYIPNMEEVLTFGREVARCVAESLQQMRDAIGDKIESIIISEFTARALSLVQDHQITTQSIPTSLSWRHLLNNQEVDLEKRLAEIERSRVIFNWPKN